MLIVSEIILLLWLIFIIYWFVSAIGSKRTINAPGQRYGIVIRIVILIIVIFGIRIPIFDRFFTGAYYESAASNPWVGALGIIICIAGIALAIWARRHLGRNWGMPMSVKEDPQLVTSGPYRFVRHPIYSGFLLAMLGSVIADGILWLIPFVFFAVYFIYSARTEEKMAIKQFPDQYPAYMKRTKMLVPFIL